LTNALPHLVIICELAETLVHKRERGCIRQIRGSKQYWLYQARISAPTVTMRPAPATPLVQKPHERIRDTRFSTRIGHMGERTNYSKWACREKAVALGHRSVSLAPQCW
jgi:hypothetical protein